MKQLLRTRVIFFLLSVAITLCMSSTTAASATDTYVAGYATAVLEHKFQIPAPSLKVKDGIVTVDAGQLGNADQAAVTSALSRIPGVVRVEVQEAEGQQTATVLSTPQQTLEATPLQGTQAAQTEDSASEGIFLPRGLLFQPLLADPRWPHFAATYRYYIDDDELQHVSGADFGGTFALYRDQAPLNGQWELGLQAGVFSIFDLKADSKDLVNSDFMVGLLTSYRRNNLSAMARLIHQSSHLGDEFLLRNRVDRVNLSYERIDMMLAYRFADMFRLYGGGGWLFDQQPSDLEPWSTQFGFDFTSPWIFLNGVIQPIAAADFKLHEEHEWSTDFSLRAGIRFGGSPASKRKLAFMLEYFKGHSPNGQFYQRKIEYTGLGLHYYFDE